MLETLVYVGTIVVIALIILLLVLSVQVYRATRTDRAKIEWALNEMNRALKQMNSNDENEIMAGLQTFSTFNDPQIQMKAIGRLTELTHSKELHVAAQSRAAIARLSAVVHQNERTANVSKSVLR